MTRIPTIFSAGFEGAGAAAGGRAVGAGTEGAGVGGGGAFCARAAGTVSRRMAGRMAASLPLTGVLEVRRRMGADRPDGAASRFITLRCPTLAELNLFPPLSKQKECLSKRLRPRGSLEGGMRLAEAS
jgi:hypothetical protein